MSGTSFGRFRVLERLGVGHVAEAFLAELGGAGDFRRLLVLKRLRDELARSPTHVRTFLDEASLVARLRHPNIVQVLDLFEHEGSLVVALELVDGPSLENLVGYTTGIGIRLPLDHGVHVVVEAARGLHFAHEARDTAGQLLGVVHRDVRPQNLLVSREGEVKVADFSIALSPSGRWTSIDQHPYAAPEQVARGEVDRRADVYSLGVMLWELVTGRRAQTAGREAGALEPPSRTSPSSLADARLDAIVARATAADPPSRHPTAERFADDLAAWLDRIPGPTGRVALARWMRESCPDLGPQKLVPLTVNASGARVPTVVPPALPAQSLPEHGVLVGREAELGKIDDAVRAGARVICLSGPTGIGKTHLAIEWARRAVARGARPIFVAAQHATTAAEVAHLVMAQLVAGTLQPRESHDALLVARDVLSASGRSVVVIDQLDRLDDAFAGLRTLAADGGDTLVVVTSRQPARAANVVDLSLPPLGVAEGPCAAVDLFFARLEDAGPSAEPWRAPASASLVRELLARVGGVPLGIVLTAARAAETSPAEIRRTLESAAPAETTGVHDLVREVWSECSEEERDALHQLSTFFAAFGISDAEAVVRIAGEVEPILGALTDRWLLAGEPDAMVLPASVRDLCRSLPDTVSLRAARERHAAHVLGRSERLLRGLRGAGAARAFALLAAAEPELRGIHAAAIATSDGERALRAALCLEPTFARRGDHRKLVTMLEVAAACRPEPALAARGAMAEARAHGWRFDFQPALEAAQRGLRHATESGDRTLVAEARSELAMVQVRCGQGDDAAVRYRDALAEMKAAGDRRGEGVVLLRLANLLSERDEPQAATMMYRLALEASREAEDRVYEGIILSNLGAQLLDEGRPDQAHQALYLSEEILRALGEERYGAVARGLIGVSLTLQGEWERGTATVEECVESLRRVGERGVIVFFLGVLVGAKARLGDRRGAVACAAQMDSLSEALAGTPVEHIAKLRRGHLDVLEAADSIVRGDVESARRLLARARRRAAAAPRNVLTTLRIASADLVSHCDAVESAIQPRETRKRPTTIGRLRVATAIVEKGRGPGSEPPR